MPKKVMVADDNKIYRESQIAQYEMFCRNQRIEAEFDEASDGEELVRKVLSSHYDLVFMGNRMQKIHGLIAIQQIREKDKTVPIYMISAGDVGQQAVALGATGYFDKRNYDGLKSGTEETIRKHLK